MCCAYVKKVRGPLRELNPGPLAPKARIIPLDQADVDVFQRTNCYTHTTHTRSHIPHSDKLAFIQTKTILPLLLPTTTSTPTPVRGLQNTAITLPPTTGTTPRPFSFLLPYLFLLPILLPYHYPTSTPTPTTTTTTGTTGTTTLLLRTTLLVPLLLLPLQYSYTFIHRFTSPNHRTAYDYDYDHRISRISKPPSLPTIVEEPNRIYDN
jgi:hypothetical protein